MLIITDTHIGARKDNAIWHQAVIHLAEDVADYCYKNNIDTITHLGDLIDDKKAISQLAYNTLNKFLEIIKPFQFIIVRGNHDTFYKDRSDVNWLNLLKSKNITTVVDKPYKHGNVTFVPWEYDIKTLDCEYLFGHFEINTFRMNNGEAIKKAKLNIVDFSRFSRVVSGHFHTPDMKENIVYIGAPYQMKFGDIDPLNMGRGFHMFNGSNGSLQAVEFNRAPKFSYIYTNEIDESKIKGNIIKIIYTEDYGTQGNEEIFQEISKCGPLLVTGVEMLSEISQVEGIELDDSEVVTPADIFISYIDTLTSLPANIDRSMLKSMIKKMTEECEK